MKTSLLLLAALSAAASADEEVVPTSYGKERYAAMTKKSPFVLATPPAAPEAPKEANFTDNMFVKGLGMGFVVVQRAGDDQPMRFWGNEKGPEQITVKEVKWSNKTGETRVVLEQNGKTGEVGFNENEMRAANTAPPPPPNGVRPPPGPPGTQRPPSTAGPTPNYQKNNSGTIPVPRPVVQNSVTVPRPTNVAVPPPNSNLSRTAAPGGNRYAPQGAAQPTQGNDSNAGRRRIREIRN